MLRSRPTLRLTITAALAGMTGAAASTITWISYRDGRNSLLDSYRLVLAQVAERIGERAKGYLGPVKNAAAGRRASWSRTPSAATIRRRSRRSTSRR